MDAQSWLLLAGLIATNIVAAITFVPKWIQRRRKGVETQALVPLKYIDQIQAGQATYIGTLETRVNTQYQLWVQSEKEKADQKAYYEDVIDRLEAKIVSLEAQIGHNTSE